jgi:glutathione peroxidase
LEEKISAQGFHVLGFLNDDFGQQGGNAQQIEACNNKYGITWPQFAMADVVGPNTQPVFSWIEAQPNPGPSAVLAPTWNFHKYLISRAGQLVGSWDTTVYPGMDPNDPSSMFATNEIVVAVEAELAKPVPAP